MVSIGILTTTYYKSREETRFHLAAQMMGNAIAAGYYVVVLDGSPDHSIAKAFGRIATMVFEQSSKDGIGASRRELFKRAGGWAYNPFKALVDPKEDGLPDIFIWTEPEKPIVPHVQDIVRPILDGHVDIVIPARTKKAWETWPNHQAILEKKANAVYKEETGLDFDVMLGPVAFKKKLLPIFATCNPKAQYGASDTYIQHIAPLEAIANHGSKACSVPVDLYYPIAQRMEEESNLSEEMEKKRAWQFAECTSTFIAAGTRLRHGVPL